MNILTQLSALDWIFISIIIGSVIIGIFAGLVQQVASAVGLVGGIVVAQIFSGALAHFLGRWIDNGNIAHVISYLSIFIGVGIVMRLFSSLTTAIIEKLALKTINRGAGALFGCFKGFVITAVIAGTLHFYHSSTTDSMVQKSLIVPYYNGFYSWFDTVIGDKKVDEARKTLREKVGLEDQ